MITQHKYIGILTLFSVEDPDTLSKYEKRKALLEENLIMEKICGNIKGRTCTNRTPQINYISREEATPPIISIEGLFS